MLPHHTQTGVVMYTTLGCSECKKVGAYMELSGIPFHVVNLSLEPHLSQTLAQETGLRKVPQIFVDGKFVGGAPQLISMHQQGMIK